MNATAPHCRRPPAKPVRTVAAVALAALVWLTACSNEPDPYAPVVNPETNDAELSEHLAGLLDEVRRRPKSAHARGNLAMAYEVNGFREAAVTTYAQATSLAPEEFLWPYLHGVLLASLGRGSTALERLARAAELDPEYAPLYVWRGTLLLDQGDNEAAEATFATAERLATHPATAAAATAGRARAMLRLDRAEEATALLEPLLDRYDHPYAHQLLGRAYRRMGRDDEARIATARGRDAAPIEWPDERQQRKADHVAGFVAKLDLAEKLLDSDPAEALAILEEQRLTHPDDRELLNNLAVALHKVGRSDDAHEVLQHAIGLYPDYHLYHFNLANYHAEGDDITATIASFNRALEANPGYMQAYERKFMLLMEEERLQEALATVDEATRYGELTAVTHFYAAMAEGLQGRWPEAITRFRRTVQLDPGMTKAHLYLGRSLAELGRFEEALRALEEGERLGTHPEVAREARSHIEQLAKGRTD